MSCIKCMGLYRTNVEFGVDGAFETDEDVIRSSDYGYKDHLQFEF